MSLIDLEKTKLIEWAKNKNDAESFFRDEKGETYFSVSDKTDIIYEFHFENIPQLKKLMEERKQTVHDTQMDLVCSVAAFKYRNTVIQPEKEKKEEKEKNVIPDFIYNF